MLCYGCCSSSMETCDGCSHPETQLRHFIKVLPSHYHYLSWTQINWTCYLQACIPPLLSLITNSSFHISRTDAICTQPLHSGILFPKFKWFREISTMQIFSFCLGFLFSPVVQACISWMSRSHTFRVFHKLTLIINDHVPNVINLVFFQTIRLPISTSNLPHERTA